MSPPLVALGYLVSHHERLPFLDGRGCRLVRDGPDKYICVFLLLSDSRCSLELRTHFIRIERILRRNVEGGHPRQKSSDNDDRHLRHALRADLLEFEFDQATHGVLLFLRLAASQGG